jgi:hypothetical protein
MKILLLNKQNDKNNTIMKNTLNITEAKIATCEKFLKEMSKLYKMETTDTKAQDQAMHIMLQVEKMIAQLEK